ncbi:hypothetical protein Hypma_008925 [Hypsizygus marmoreus]|uniref:F-box domain-containing protein n=1 Tax=Hypsizygus marmoreus TaxID=39966 RepID=A0A369JUM2_HYPMA|nr:hypothetical protein Hypma_008925 [Hypsizygus marmoreus]
METSNAPQFLLLPSELILLILSHLGVDEVLALRQTCVKLSQLTADRTLWLQLLHRQYATLPLPSHLRRLIESEDPTLLDLPHLALVPEVRFAHRIAQSWTQPRRDRPVKLEPKTANSLLGFEVFLDRWLLAAYGEGIVQLWDINPHKSDSTLPFLEATDKPYRSVGSSTDIDMQNGGGGWTSFTAALDSSEQFIIFALTKSASMPPETKVSSIFIGPPPNYFVHMLSTPSMSPQTIRTIDPNLGFYISSGHNNIEINQWSVENSSVSKRSVTLETQPGDVWNGILDIRVVGPYLVIFKARTLELHDYLSVPYFEHPYSQLHDLPVMIYNFPPALTFRYISCADYTATEPNDPESPLFFEFLGYDVLKGTFRFVASILFVTKPSGQTDAGIDVRCLGVSALANNLDLNQLFPYFPFAPGSRSETSPSVEPQRDTPAPSPQDTPTPTPLASHAGIFGPTDAGEPAARGFVSAMSLGPQGRRAVWVERTRGSTLREVRVWSKEPDEEDDDAKAIDMPTHVVYSVGSYDLREDITHCAIAEASGTIILGNRAGDIFVLGLNILK